MSSSWQVEPSPQQWRAPEESCRSRGVRAAGSRVGGSLPAAHTPQGASYAPAVCTPPANKHLQVCTIEKTDVTKGYYILYIDLC